MLVNRRPHWLASRLTTLTPSAWPSSHAVCGLTKCTCVSAVTQFVLRQSSARPIFSFSSFWPGFTVTLVRTGAYSKPLLTST